MSDLSLQSGPKRTLIKSRGAFALPADRERALDTLDEARVHRDQPLARPRANRLIAPAATRCFFR